MTSTPEPITVTESTPALDPQLPEFAPTVANAAPTVPEATPASADTPESTTASGATVPSNASSSVPPPEGGNQAELLHLFRELLVQEEQKEQPQPPVKPLIGEYNLIVEGVIKVRSDDGIMVDIPINALLARALAPGSIQGAQQQFATILDHLVLKPATVEFIEYIGRVEADRQLIH